MAVKKFNDRRCARCGNQYTPTTGPQKYCGSKRQEGSCSREEYLVRMRQYGRVPKHRAANTLRHRERRFRKYGIDKKVFLAMIEKQNGVCAVCGSAPGAKGFQIDHDHKTGETRGLLCTTCNVRLGSLESSWFQNAAAYLRRTTGPWAVWTLGSP